MQVRFPPKVAGTHMAQAVTATSIRFPGGGRAETVVVRNTGSLPMVVLPTEIVGQDRASFRARDGACTRGALAPGADCSIAVTFVSTATRVHRASLVVPTEGAPGPAEVTLAFIPID
jgi:glycine cleavage system aminomethyltransferase T